VSPVALQLAAMAQPAIQFRTQTMIPFATTSGTSDIFKVEVGWIRVGTPVALLRMLEVAPS